MSGVYYVYVFSSKHTKSSTVWVYVINIVREEHMMAVPTKQKSSKDINHIDSLMHTDVVYNFTEI